jgi:hypothetical protein
MPELSSQTFLPKVVNYLEQAKPMIGTDRASDSKLIVQTLGQGEYNMNFLVRQGELAWVLRVNTGSQIGLSAREQIAYEFKTLTLLTPTGISPEPYFLDDSFRFLPYGILGMAYLPGEHLDYRCDLKKAAQLFARYHQFKIPKNQVHLIRDERPLTRSYQRCMAKLQVYLNSPLANPHLRMYLLEVLNWADEARLKEAYFINDPWNCIINTEVNSSNWIIDRKTETLHLVDWEKPLWGDPSRDLSHFRVPTTTLWKTNYRMSKYDKAIMMDAYREQIADPHLRDTIEERTRLRDPFNCLRGISWCAMRWIQYQRGEVLLKNEDTRRKLEMYVDLDFVRSLFDPYLN